MEINRNLRINDLERLPSLKWMTQMWWAIFENMLFNQQLKHLAARKSSNFVINRKAFFNQE